MRRLTLAGAAAALVFVVAVPFVLANPNVTLLLTNGQRVSGELVYHHDDNMAVRVNGREKSYPQGEIAAIEFAPGTPASTELAELPTGTSEMQRNAIVLKSGRVIPAHLYDISDDGNTITIKTSADQRQNFSADDVARIYLHPTKARSLYASNATPGSVATSGQQAGYPLGGPFTVDARQPWTATGVRLKKGDRVAFHASGEVRWGQGPGQVAGPDGAAEPASARAGLPVPQMGVGGLIARVGDSKPFPIGSNSDPIVMPADGELFLGVNDNQRGDNSGSFQVRAWWR